MKKIKEIIIGTNNNGKYKEICDLLPDEIEKYEALINEFSSKLVPISSGVKIPNCFGEYFFILFGNKPHISLYFPSLFVPITTSLILFILH